MIEQNTRPRDGEFSGDVAVGQYDVNGPDSLLISVVETASAQTRDDELNFPALEDSIDIESLQAALRSLERSDTEASGHVEFEHDDLAIQIHVDGLIVVRRTE